MGTPFEDLLDPFGEFREDVTDAQVQAQAPRLPVTQSVPTRLDPGGLSRLQQFRVDFPMYDDIPDDVLVERMHRRLYSDMDFGAFAEAIGYQPPEAPKRPNVLQRTADRIAAKDGDWKNLLAINPKNHEDVAAVLMLGPHIEEEEPKGYLQSAREQIFVGWKTYLANRATAAGADAVEDYQGATQTALGQGTGDPGGVLGVSATNLKKQLRAIRADSGDGKAQRQIIMEADAARRQARDALQESIDARRRHIAEIEGIAPREVTTEMIASPTFMGSIEAASQDPVGVMVDIQAQSAPNMIDGMVLGAIGSVLGTKGFIAGMGVGSGMAEFRSSYADSLIAEGVDLTSADSILAAAENPELMQRVKERALTRATIIGTTEAAGAGIASRITTPFVKNFLGKLVANTVTQAPVQVAAGAGGEALAQAALGEELRPGEIVAEGLGELGGAIVEPIQASAAKAFERAWGRTPADEAPAEDARPREEKGVRDIRQDQPAFVTIIDSAWKQTETGKNVPVDPRRLITMGREGMTTDDALEVFGPVWPEQLSDFRQEARTQLFQEYTDEVEAQGGLQAEDVRSYDDFLEDDGYGASMMRNAEERFAEWVFDRVASDVEQAFSDAQTRMAARMDRGLREMRAPPPRADLIGDLVLEAGDTTVTGLSADVISDEVARIEGDLTAMRGGTPFEIDEITTTEDPSFEPTPISPENFDAALRRFLESKGLPVNLDPQGRVNQDSYETKTYLNYVDDDGIDTKAGNDLVVHFDDHEATTIQVPIRRIVTNQEFVGGLRNKVGAPLDQTYAALTRIGLTLQDGNHRMALQSVFWGPDAIVKVRVPTRQLAEIEAHLAEEPAVEVDETIEIEPEPVPKSKERFQATVQIDDMAQIREIGNDSEQAVIESARDALQRAGGVKVTVEESGQFKVEGPPAEVEAAIGLANATLGSQTVAGPFGEYSGVSLSSPDVQAQNRRQGVVRDSRAPVLDMKPGNNYVPMIGLTGELPLNANNELVLGHGRVVQIPKNAISRRHIIKELERAFGLAIYEGRVRGDKLRLGFFRVGPGEIRIKKPNDIEVAAHEVAHWLDEKNPWMRTLYQQHSAEMKGVSYDSESDIEGFAEFFRLFMTDDWSAMDRAPSFYDAFVKELRRRPSVGEPVFRLQNLMHAWHAQGVRKRFLGRIGDNALTAWDKIQNTIPSSEDVIRRGLDGLRTIRTAELRATDGKSTKAYNLMRLGVGGWSQTVTAFFRYGTAKWNADRSGLEFNGESLEQIFGGWWGNDDMAMYMLARRAQELESQGRESGFRPDEIQYGLELGRVHEEFEGIFEQYQEFNKRLLDFAEDNGILSVAGRAAMEEINKNYVPFHRVMDSFDQNSPAQAGGNPFMRLRGSSRNVKPVWENINGNMIRIIRSALINNAKRSLYRTLGAAQNQESAFYATAISADSRKTNVPMQSLTRKIVDALGMDWDRYRVISKIPEGATREELAVLDTVRRIEEGAGDFIEVFQGGVDPKGNVDFYMDDGKKHWMEIHDPGLWESIQFLTPQAVNVWVRMLAGPAQLLRVGVTSTPTFAAANLARDTTSAWMQSKGQHLPVVGAVRGVTDQFMNNPLYQEAVLNGATFGQGAQYRDHVVDTFSPSATRGVRALWGRYQDLLTKFENANRLAEYRRVKEKGGTIVEAAIAGRDVSTDFSMRGSSQAMRTLSLIVPFLNARIQGLWRLGRTKEDGIALSYGMKGAMLALASVALYAFNKDDERYEELPEDVKDLNWIFYTGAGENDYYMIPKPFESGMLFATIPERMFELAETKNGKEFSDALRWQAMETFGFNIVPQAFEPLRQLEKNKAWTGAPIVPGSVEGAYPGEQWTAYTSLSMRAAGRAWPKTISPAKMDHLIKGYFGTMGTYGLAAGDAMFRATAGDLGEGPAPDPGESWRDNILVRNAVGRFVPREGPPRRTKFTTDFYDMVREVEMAARTLASRQKRESDRVEEFINDPEMEPLLNAVQTVRSYRRQLSNTRFEMNEVRANPKLTAAQKRDRLWALQRERNDTARRAVAEIAPLIRQPDLQVSAQ